jgi:hypothetical protein
MRGISSLTEDLLACQEGLCSMELVCSPVRTKISEQHTAYTFHSALKVEAGNYYETLLLTSQTRRWYNSEHHIISINSPQDPIITILSLCRVCVECVLRTAYWQDHIDGMRQAATVVTCTWKGPGSSEDWGSGCPEILCCFSQHLARAGTVP